MITLRQVVSNIGKGQSGMGVKHILNELTTNYNKIKGNIKIINSGILDDGTGIHVKVPSSTANVYYDVILWLDSYEKVTLDTQFKCYSNSPSFGYNFAYLFNTDGSLLFPEKYPHSFLTMPPKMRNPYGFYGFDKGVFAAVKYVGSRNLTKLNKEYENVDTQPVATFDEKKAELGR
jgi:hypothetical protein